MEYINIDEKVKEQFIKLKSIFLCSNTVGQCVTDLMVNPPTVEGGYSKKTVEEFEGERAELYKSLKARAKIVTDQLNSIEGITCNQVEGAMYAFPQIKFPEKFVEKAQKDGKEPDLVYCVEVLEKTGIVLVPGSGFRQKEGTYHFRITTLIRPEEKLEEKLKVFKKFNEEFFSQYK